MCERRKPGVNRRVQALRDRDTAGEWHVTVLGVESRPAYDQVALFSYVDGVSAEDLTLPRLGADLHLGDPAVAVDPALEFTSERGQRVPVALGLPGVGA